MRWACWLVLLGSLTACTMEDRATVPQPPQIVTIFLPAVQQCVEVVQLPQPAAVPMTTAWGGAKGTRAPKPVNPLTLIHQAHTQARIAPSRQGYFGGTAEYTYTWQPGKIFEIFLRQGQPTSLRFPKDDFITQQFFPNEQAFQVVSQRIGSEQRGYDVITIVPQLATGEWDTFVLGDSGRKYNLHLIVGERGMLGVAFETAPVLREAPPRLPLPKPVESPVW
jgi:type IV secretion system protein VirB9